MCLKIVYDIIYYENGKDSSYGDGSESDAHSEEDARKHTVVYITKAGCFTGREFGIKPSKYEIDHNILIVGHRCVPFVDGDVLPFEIKFIAGKKNLKFIKNNIKITSNTIVLPKLGEVHYRTSPQYKQLLKESKKTILRSILLVAL